ncbi:MAG: tetratricopeptide repeat protein [Candidatus Marinimicrobia bacterium]|jgi:outer membrane protein assembly factor BamD (BamD/ComL family)|nr:tetratricopeptide repeat protein [Candidatus Neomarinimicrobiota bacterium]MDP7026635.1 tetratricopeptide repeat protein [Candidatus Neomarinimicrobiota bacterium]|tara:strand:- start:2313 stop:2780 length:468 start_codon:yes stop_codon:yes gene_type:complete
MHEQEILLFTEAFKAAQEKFYVDAIHKFQKLVNDFPESDLADDAMYNIGLCYYEMNQFQKCIEVLEEMIDKYPDATITALENGNEFGKTAAKAYYLIVQCNIGLGDIQKAESNIPILENFTNTYVVKNSEKFSFAQLAEEAIQKYIGLKGHKGDR